MKKQFKLLVFSVITTIALTVGFISCRKTDLFPNDAATTLENRFFNTHRSADPIEKSIVEFVKRKNDKKHFIEKTAAQIGYPRWDKIVKKPLNTARTGNITTLTVGGSAAENNIDVYYVPFVRDSQNYVNASMVIKITPTDTSFSYLCDWQCSQLQNNTNALNDQAENFAVFFMRLDNLVFGHTKFKINDKNIFRFNSHNPLKVELKPSDSSGVKTNTISYVETCVVVTVFYEDCNGCFGSCDGCNKCTSSISWTYCSGQWVNSGGSTSSGGGGGGSTSGGGGGGGSISGGETLPNPCGDNEPTSSSTIQNGNIATFGSPCNHNSFWTPIIYTPQLQSLINTLGLTQLQIGWLENNHLYTNELYDWLNGEELDDETIAAALISIDLERNGLDDGPYEQAYFDIVNLHSPVPLPSNAGMMVTSKYRSHFIANYLILKEENPTWSKWRLMWEATRDTVHLMLDLAGMVPVIGEIADLTNGTIYLISGDTKNAALSAASAIPVIGWYTAGIKLAKRSIHLANGSKVVLRWYHAGSKIVFSGRSQLRKVLGLAKGDARVAHHILPWEWREHPLVQLAAQAGFHMNEALNGIPSIFTTNHPLYNNRVLQRLIALENALTVSGHLNPNNAKIAVENLIDQIRAVIVAHPNTPLDDLVNLF